MPPQNKKILILCPLSLELEALISALEFHGHHHHTRNIGPLLVYEFEDLGWSISLAGHGKTQFGIQTQYLIHHYDDLDAILCCGCAGGLGEGIEIFDVVVATKTIEHDYQLKFVSRPVPEFPGHPQLLAEIKSISSERFSIHFAPIASGDEDIIDTERANQLHVQTGAAAVAWEGAGGARASLFNKIPFLEIRGITDSANSSAPINFAENLKQVMNNISMVLLDAFAKIR